MDAVRTCIGSRRRATRSSLLRVVALSDGSVVADPKAVMPGRGGMAHTDRRSVRTGRQAQGIPPCAPAGA
ncbi:DUF448 domain-containing protein [Curtobacterium sp. MCJR17_043]|nr:DUF448 domain-containing protein [Curtobacterium sp. MCJR17_043]WIB37040.1 DUF448 domain-containing protein [Curtobacterium sp. MCJR17_043]